MARLANQGHRSLSLQTLLVHALLLGFSKPATIASPFDLTRPNLTSLVAHDPDVRFKIVPHYTNDRLPATAILMSTVYLLAEAADLDMNSELEFDRPFVAEDYPSVSIDLQKNIRHSVILPSAFLVWALYLAAIDMIDNNKFVVSSFDLLWKGRIYASLRYQKPEPGASFESAANGSHNFQVSASSNYSAMVPSDRSYTKNRASETFSVPLVRSPETVNTLVTDPLLTIHMQYLQDARILPIGTVFAMTLEMLKNDAEFPANSLVQSSSTTKRVFDATLEIQRSEGPSTMTPPYFEYMHLNRAIRQVPRLMLDGGKFAEVAFQIEIDQKELGTGRLIKGLPDETTTIAAS
ncbi:MAG: hypothetical protein HETSPECPRED_001494 [Heterodermia speciosa]|uniref:Uncharacterized protein n=1 Tax=Heterodermia speciosa TaxID=116794 RepID=A0A8H3J1U4_9LECA|nr:MAG: hypothetical protein HETSPECPRED_001494 [Heterodermia speciosa]